MAQGYKYRISLIIPVYNVEKYIEKCLKSAVNQDYEDYEIVIVDDGSTDGSYDICERYAKQYRNIKLLHKKNEGLMATWIKGLSLSQGEYVAFLDSDDWVDRTYLSQLSKGIEKKADVTCCNKSLEYEKYSVILKEKIPAGVYAREAIVCEVFPKLLNNGSYLGREITPHRCGKLFKKEVLTGNVQYCDRRISFGEDLNIVFPALYDCRRLVMLEDAKGLYHYRQNRQSIARMYKQNMFSEICWLRERLIDINERKGGFDFLEQIDRDFACLFLEWIKNEARSEKAYHEIIKEILNNFHEKKYCLNASWRSIALKSFDKALVRSLVWKSKCGLFLWLFLYRGVKRNLFVNDLKVLFQEKNKKNKIRVLMIGPHKSVKGGIHTVVDNYMNWNDWENIDLIYRATFIEKNNLKKALFYALHFAEICLICLFGRIDVVHLHVSERGSFYRKAFIIYICRRRNIKTILHHHGAEFFEFYDSANDARKQYIKRVIETVDVNVVLSEYQKAEMKSRFPNACYGVLYNTLSICGDGAVEEVKERLEELQLWHRITYLGWCSKQDLEARYREAMVYILPSYNEGLPMALLEAMGHGIPCIASKVAAIPEVIKDRDNGLLIMPGDVKGIQKAVEYLSNNPDVRREIGKKGYDSVKKKFLTAEGIDKLKELYCRLK